MMQPTACQGAVAAHVCGLTASTAAVTARTSLQLATSLDTDDETQPRLLLARRMRHGWTVALGLDGAPNVVATGLSGTVVVAAPARNTAADGPSHRAKVSGTALTMLAGGWQALFA